MPQHAAHQTRVIDLQFEAEGRAQDDGRIPVVVSTAAPVEMPDGVEVLVHTREAIDLSRAPLPIIATHRGNQINVGIVEDLVPDGRQLKGLARFGERAEAAEYAKDVRDGIIRSVSVGYRRIRTRVRAGGELVTELWMPTHVAMVAEPADVGAGFYREQQPPFELIVETDDSTPATAATDVGRSMAAEASHAQPKEIPVSEVTTPAAPAAPTQPDIRVIASQAQQQERERIVSIRAMGKAHNVAELAEQAIDTGTTVDVFRAQVLDQLVQRGSVKPAVASPTIGMTDKEVRQFSVTKLMYATLNPDDRQAREAAAFEIECSVAARKLSPVDDSTTRGNERATGYRVPFDVLSGPAANSPEMARAMQARLHQRDLNVGTTTAGGNLVATNLLAASFIELLRNRIMVANLGATMLDGLVGNVAIPSQTAGAQTYWVTEGNAVTESELTVGQVTLTPKTVGMFTDYSRRTLLQATPAIEALVRADLAAGLAVEIDRAALHGSAASGQPRGIAATAGIGSVAGGTNGAAPTYLNMIVLEEAVAVANADVGSMAFLTNARMRAQLRGTQQFASTNGVPVWGADNTVLGYRAAVSNNVSSTLTKGTANGVCSAIFFGNFSDLLIGMWGGLDLILDTSALATSGGRRLVALQDVDVAVRRAASFAAMLDALRT